MKFSWKKINEKKVKYLVLIEKKELDEKSKEAKSLILENIKLPGFRKGAKIPPQILKKHHTPKNIAFHGAKALINEAYSFALDSAEKQKAPAPFKMPKIDIDLNDKLDATIEISFTPKIHIIPVDLSTVVVKPDEEKYKVTKEKIEKHIETMRDKLSSIILKEKGKLEKGNFAIIDFEGQVDGETFEGGTAKNHELLVGSGQFIPGFEDQLIGMKTGEEKMIKVTFPENYQVKHLQNVDVDFKVKLNEIRVKELIKDDKEFIETLNVENVKTMKDVHEYAKGILSKGLERQKDEDIWALTITEVINKSDFYFPDKAIDDEFHKLKKTFIDKLAERKITLDVYVELFGTTEERVNEAIKNDATNNLKKESIIPTIGNLMGIKIEDKDIEAFARDILKERLKDFKDQQLFNFISANRTRLYHVLLERKVKEDTIDKFHRGENLKKEGSTKKEEKQTKQPAKKETTKTKKETSKPKKEKQVKKPTKKTEDKKETTKKKSTKKEVKSSPKKVVKK